MVHQSAHNANHEVDNASNLKLPFPAKLLKLLEESEKNDTTHIVAWLPTGKAFKIHDDDKFSEVVMGKYFRQSKIKSFTRQLYIYGFTKISTGPNLGGFFHPKFVRNNPKSCLSVARRDGNEDRRCKRNRPAILEDLKQSLALSKVKKYGQEQSFSRVSPSPVGSPIAPASILMDHNSWQDDFMSQDHRAVSPLHFHHHEESVTGAPGTNMFQLSMGPATEMLAKRALPGPPQSLRGPPAANFCMSSGSSGITNRCSTLTKAAAKAVIPARVQSMGVMEALDDVLSMMIEPRSIEDMSSACTNEYDPFNGNWHMIEDSFQEEVFI